MNYFLLLAILLSAVQTIHIPMRSNRPRCLVEYLVGKNTGTIKMKAVLPKVSSIQPGEHYTISIRNTETQQVITEIIAPGDKFSKEQPLEENFIYEVCLTLKSERELEVLAQYSSESVYRHDHSQIEVPKSLLTKDDMKSAYLSAAYLEKKVKEFQEQQSERQKQENNAFTQTENLNTKLTTLSIVEITVVVLAGLYQFLTLRNYLSSKQYI